MQAEHQKEVGTIIFQSTYIDTDRHNYWHGIIKCIFFAPTSIQLMLENSLFKFEYVQLGSIFPVSVINISEIIDDVI